MVNTTGDVTKTRLFFSDGLISSYDDPKLALDVYYGLPRGIKVAFRSAGDKTPVYPHDYVDRR